MIKVYSISFSKIEKYKDDPNIEVFYEKYSRYFEFFNDDIPIGFFRLRHKNEMTNHGNNFIYENQRGKGWGNKILLVSLNVIKTVFPNTNIIYVQVHTDNKHNIYIRDKQFGIENRYFETEEPNRFGFKESTSEVDDTFKEILYYDTIDNLWNRNKKHIDELEVVYEG